MDRKTLEKLRGELEAMKGVPQRGSDVASLAERLGRKRVKRGKEPTFESDFDIPVITIPMHGSKSLKNGTQRGILIQLEDALHRMGAKIRLRRAICGSARSRKAKAWSHVGKTHMSTATEYLKKPYGRLLVPEDEGGYRAEIIEFPGCFAEGNGC
jgi:predicted RNA binding protein YcfA (HicA-like mRNA interferase family)